MEIRNFGAGPSRVPASVLDKAGSGRRRPSEPPEKSFFRPDSRALRHPFPAGLGVGSGKRHPLRARWRQRDDYWRRYPVGVPEALSWSATSPPQFLDGKECRQRLRPDGHRGRGVFHERFPSGERASRMKNVRSRGHAVNASLNPREIESLRLKLAMFRRLCPLGLGSVRANPTGRRAFGSCVAGLRLRLRHLGPMDRSL